MWTWLLLDSIFYRPRYYYGNRGQRIAIAAVSSILVLVLFYPTAIYAAYTRKGIADDEESTGQSERHAPEGDTTPLLAEGT